MDPDSGEHVAHSARHFPASPFSGTIGLPPHRRARAVWMAAIEVSLAWIASIPMSRS